jgi:hypothetical protein
MPQSDAPERVVRSGCMWRRLSPWVVALLALSAAPMARAADSEAGQAFDHGAQAFRRGDFRGAGEAFDRAYTLAPHPDALWNAAQAWERAQEPARAANRYAAYVALAADDAPDRGRAGAALARLSPRLGRIDVRTRGQRATVDEEEARIPSVYVHAGAHEVRAGAGGRVVRRMVRVSAGEVVAVVLDEELPAPEPSAVPALAPPRPAPQPGGVPPWVAYAGAGMTLAAGAFTVWSGLDTVGAKHDFLAAPNEVTLEGGRSREVRTNVALALTAGLGAATAVTALFFVRWRSPSRALEAALGPRGGVFVVRY